MKCRQRKQIYRVQAGRVVVNDGMKERWKEKNRAKTFGTVVSK